MHSFITKKPYFATQWNNETFITEFNFTEHNSVAFSASDMIDLWKNDIDLKAAETIPRSLHVI